jgi:hypothetical protein
MGLVPQEDVLVEVGGPIDNLSIDRGEVGGVSTECYFALCKEASGFQACARELFRRVYLEWARTRLVRVWMWVCSLPIC